MVKFQKYLKEKLRHVQDRMITNTYEKRRLKLKKYSMNRKITKIASDMPEIMWHVLRILTIFSIYIYQTNKKIYYVPTDLALFSFEVIMVQPQLTPLNTVFLVSFVGNGK